jgi:hypothetical protein
VRPPDDKSIRRWYKKFSEIDSVEKRHSIDGLGNLMKMGIRMVGFCMESEEANLPSKCRVTHGPNDSPHNPSEKPTSKTIQITGSPETYRT